MVKKGYYENECFGLAWGCLEVCRTNLFITPLALFVKMGFSKITMNIFLQQIMVSTRALIQITHKRRHLNNSQNYLHHMKIQEALDLAPGREEVQLVWVSFSL